MTHGPCLLLCSNTFKLFIKHNPTCIYSFFALYGLISLLFLSVTVWSVEKGSLLCAQMQTSRRIPILWFRTHSWLLWRGSVCEPLRLESCPPQLEPLPVSGVFPRAWDVSQGAGVHFINGSWCEISLTSAVAGSFAYRSSMEAETCPGTMHV